MELDNKFGICCKCPAIMHDSRLFTNYMPHKMYNLEFMQHLQVTNNNEYRNILQNKLQVNDETLNKMCNKNNKFNIDGSIIDLFFNSRFKNQMCNSE